MRSVFIDGTVSQVSEVAYGLLDIFKKPIGFVMHIYQKCNVTYILIQNKNHILIVITVTVYTHT